MLTRAVRPARCGVRRSRAATWVDDHRVLVAFVLGVGEHVRQQLAGQNSSSVHQNASTPLVRPVTCGRPVGSSGVGGA